MDLDVNAIDKRIYSVFHGFLQDGFRTLQIFLLDVSAQCRQRTGTDSRRKTKGPNISYFTDVRHTRGAQKIPKQF
jgi:hypothetical protein